MRIDRAKPGSGVKGYDKWGLFVRTEFGESERVGTPAAIPREELMVTRGNEAERLDAQGWAGAEAMRHSSAEAQITDVERVGLPPHARRRRRKVALHGLAEIGLGDVEGNVERPLPNRLRRPAGAKVQTADVRCR